MRAGGVTAAILMGFQAILAGETPPRDAPNFDLPRWQSDQRVRLTDFAGQILVLDFFAYWCAPCEVASKELESGVQAYYASRKGNPQGVPVRVVSVNIERDLPEQTEAFLRRTGASFVLHDPSASLLAPFGQAGIPFLVLIDGTAARAGDPGYRVVYQHAGFEGTRRLRRLIDGLGATAAPAPAPGTVAAGTGQPRGVPLVQTFEADSEWVWSSDFLLSDSQLRYEQERGSTTWDLAFGYGSFDEDYRPYKPLDFFGFKEHLHEDRYSGVVNLRQRVATPLTLLASANALDGYPNYRRVWIANRYRQKYDHPDFPRVPGYQEPSPSQWGASLGARWEYLPTVGFAEFKPSYTYERAAPGYEDGTNSVGDYKLIRARENLDTIALTVSSENILTRRIRTLNEFMVGQTTDREVRFGYKGSLNLALGERWVLRGVGGIASEKPEFHAYYFGLTAEYELTPNLFVSVSGRYYSDTGEIENSLPITSAAPPLRSWEAGAGIRYTIEKFSVKLYGGPFWTDYERRPGIGEEFLYLYTDRNWGLAQLGVSLQF